MKISPVKISKSTEAPGRDVCKELENGISQEKNLTKCETTRFSFYKKLSEWVSPSLLTIEIRIQETTMKNSEISSKV